MLGHEDNQLVISDAGQQTNESSDNNQVSYNSYSSNDLKNSCSMSNWTVSHDSCSSRTLSLNDSTHDNLLFHDSLNNNEDKRGTNVQQKLTPNDFNNNQQLNFSILLSSQNMSQDTSHCLSQQQQADPHLEQSFPSSGFYVPTGSEEFIMSNQQNPGQYIHTSYTSHMEHDSSMMKGQSDEQQKSSMSNSGVLQSNHHEGFSNYDQLPQHSNQFQCQDPVEENCNYTKHQTFENGLFSDADNQHCIQQQRLYQPVQLQVLDIRADSNKPACDSVLVDRPLQQHQQQPRLVGIGAQRDNHYAFEDEYPPGFQQLSMNCDNYNNQVSTTTIVTNETNQATNKVRSFKGRRGRPRKKGLRSKSKCAAVINR